MRCKFFPDNIHTIAPEVQVRAVVPFKIGRFHDLTVLQTATFVNGDILLDIPTIPTSISQTGSSPHISFDILMDSQHCIHEYSSG